MSQGGATSWNSFIAAHLLQLYAVASHACARACMERCVLAADTLKQKKMQRNEGQACVSEYRPIHINTMSNHVCVYTCGMGKLGVTNADS